MENLYNYLFHYNSYEDLWYAIPRDLYMEYWNNSNVEGVLKCESIDQLILDINSQKFIEDETQ